MPVLDQDALFELIRTDPALFSFSQHAATAGLWLQRADSPAQEWCNPAFWHSLTTAPPPNPSISHSHRTYLLPEDVRLEAECIEKARQTPGQAQSCRLRYRDTQQRVLVMTCQIVYVDRPAGGYVLGGLTRDQALSPYAAWEPVLHQSHSVYALQIDTQGRYAQVNQAFLQRFGIAERDCLGQSSLMHIVPEDHEACRVATMACLSRPGVPQSVMLRKPGPDGQPFLTQWEFTAQHDPQSQEPYILAVGYDLTPERQAGQMYQNLAHNLFDTVVRLDAQGRFIWVSPSWTSTYGYALADLEGRHMRELLAPGEEAEPAPPVFASHQREGHMERVTLRLLAKDGNTRWLEALLVWDEMSQELMVIGRDFTERWESEQKLAFQARLLEAVRQAVIATDAQGIIQFWNPAAEQLYGWSAQEALGQPVYQLTPSQQSQAEAMAIMQDLMAGKAWEGEFEVKNRAGQSFMVHVVNSPAFDSLGNLVGIIGVSTDVSERLRTRQALTESEQKYRLLVDTAPMGIVIHAPERIEYLNAYGAKLLGGSVEDLLGQPITRFLPPDTREQSQQQVTDLYQQRAGSVSISEETIIDLQGEVRDLLITGVLIPYGEGQAVCSVFADITAQRQAQEELARSEQRYRFLFDNTKDLVCVHDLDGRYLQVSPASQLLLGYSPEEMQGWDPYQLVFPEDVARIQTESHQQVLDGSTATRVQYRIRHRDGHYRWFDTYTEPIRDEASGEITYLMTTSRDITELKALNQEVERLSNLFQAMLRNTDDFIFFKDREHRFLAGSQSVLDYLGLEKAEDLLEKRDEDFLAAEEAGFFRRIEEQVLAEGQVIQEIHPYTLPGQAQSGYTDNRKYPIHNAAGEVVGLYGVARDITALKTAETQLQRSRDLLLEAQRLAQLGSYETDLVNGTWTGSENFIRLFGLPPKPQYEIAEFQALIHPEDEARVMAHFQACLAQRRDFNCEYRVVRPTDGQVRHVDSRSLITYAEDGTPLRIHGVKQDITDRKEAEGIKRLAEQLERKNKELEQFAYVASHDLQEPLRTIRSYLTLLVEDYEVQFVGDAELYIRFINEASERMARLIRELLDYSRLGRGRVKSQVATGPLIEAVIADLRARIRETQAQVHLGELPTIVGYELELRQLFQNLISNALKFCRPEVTPDISISAQAEEEAWVFRVRDNGIGIAPQYQAKIFNLFQRLHKRTEFEGTGIGLAHCKKIVELHEGQIWVESTPGQGSTFGIRLPQPPTLQA